MYDIVIVGAGPAGSTLARLVGNDYRVLIIDKRDLAGGNSGNQMAKCCGGLLAPDAQRILAKLGLGMPKHILVDPQLFAVRTIDGASGMERLYQRFYVNIDRQKFDEWLVSMIPHRVDSVFNATFREFTSAPGGYDVRYVYNKQEVCVRTKVIIGADGANSRVRRLLGGGMPMPEQYIAIQEWFECREPMPYFTAVFDNEVSDFYSWTIPKGDHLLLGSALRPGEGALAKFGLLKTKLARLGFDFSRRTATEGAHILRPRRTSHLLFGRDNIALIGEAAGAISPSSAQGISYALGSAHRLAQSLEGGIGGFMHSYTRKMGEVRLSILGKNVKCPVMYNPLLRRLVMGSGLQSIG